MTGGRARSHLLSTARYSRLACQCNQHYHDDQTCQCRARDEGKGSLQWMRVEIMIVTMLDVHERPHGDPPGNEI